MLKLASLRALLTQCVPEFVTNPDRLIVMGDNGQLVATGTASLSFEYRYTASITVMDYTGHADALMVPIIAWVKTNQSELLDNPQKRENAIRFSIYPLDTGACDIGIELDLTERAVVKALPDHPTRLTVTHPDEPGLIGLARFDGEQVQASGSAAEPKPERWELWFKDEQLAAWDLMPPAFIGAFHP